MDWKNFRVFYQLNNQNYHIDFSMRGKIDDETKSISAWNEIRKNHPNIRRDDISNIQIEDLEVW